MIDVIFSVLLAPRAAAPVRLSALLRPGISVARPGSHCGGSVSALGTSNVNAEGDDLQSTVVNIWRVETPRKETIGYIVRLEDGALYHEDPIGLSYQKVTNANENFFLRRGLAFVGCFKADLSRSFLVDHQ